MSWITDIFDTVGGWVGAYTPTQPTQPTPPTVYMPVQPRPSPTPAPTPVYTPPPMAVVPRESQPIYRTPVVSAPSNNVQIVQPRQQQSTQIPVYMPVAAAQSPVSSPPFTVVQPRQQSVSQPTYVPLAPRGATPYSAPFSTPLQPRKSEDWWSDPASNQSIVNMGMTGSGNQSQYAPVNPRPLDQLNPWGITPGPQVPNGFAAPDTWLGKVERDLYSQTGLWDYAKGSAIGQAVQGVPNTARSIGEAFSNPTPQNVVKAAGETLGTGMGLGMGLSIFGALPASALPVLNTPTVAVKEATGALQEGQDIQFNDYGARWKMAQEAKAAGKSRDEVNKILFGENRDLNSYAQETANLLGQDYAKKYRESSRVNILGLDVDLGDAAKYVPERDNPVNYAVKETRDMAFSGNNALRVQAQNRILAGEDPAVAIDGAYAPGPTATMDQQQLWQTRVREFTDARGRLARVDAIKAGWNPAQVSQAEQQARVEAQQLINNTGVIPGSKDVITDMVGETAAGFIAGHTGLDPFPQVNQALMRLTGLDKLHPRGAAEKRADWLDEVYVPEMEKRVAADLSGVNERVYKEGEKAATAVADPNANPVEKAFAKMYLDYTKLAGRTERAKASQQAQVATDFMSRLIQGADTPWTVIQRITGMTMDAREVMKDAPELGDIPISVRAEMAKPVITNGALLKKLTDLPSLNEPDFNPARFMVEFSDLAQKTANQMNGVGAKPPTLLEKIVGAQKAVMGEMYLRTPGYVIKQVLSDHMTMAADGVVSFDSRNEINDFLGRIGVSKSEISNELNAMGEPQGRESLLNKVPVVGKVLAAIPDKIGDVASQWDFDRRVRAQYAGIRQYLDANWKPTVSPDVRKVLGDTVADAFEANMRGALSSKELRDIARRHYDPKGAGDAFSASQWLQKSGVPLDSISPAMLVQMENGARELANRGAAPEETKAFFDKWRDEIDKHWRKNVASMGDVVNPRQTTENVARSDMDEVQHGATELVKNLMEVGGMKPDEAVKRVNEVMTPLVKGEEIIRAGRESLADKLGGIVDKPDVDVNKVASLLNWAMNKEYELRGDYRQQQAELYRKARAELDANRRGPTAAEAWAGQVWREYFDNNRRNATKMHDDVANAYHWTAGAVDNFLAGADWNVISKEQPDLLSIEGYAQKLIDSTRAQVDAQGLDGFNKMLASDRVKGDQARQELFRRGVVTLRAEPTIAADIFDVLMTSEKDVRMNAAKAATEAELVRDQMVVQGMDMKDYYTRIGEIWRNHFDFAEQRNAIAMTQLAYTQARNSEMGRMLQGLGYNDKAIAQMFARMDTAEGKAAVQKELAQRQQRLAAMAAEQQARAAQQAQQAVKSQTGIPADEGRLASEPRPSPLDGQPDSQRFTESPARDRVETYLREQFKDLPDQQMQAAMAVMDARAEIWARQNNTTPDGWYSSRLATGEESQQNLRVIEPDAEYNPEHGYAFVGERRGRKPSSDQLAFDFETRPETTPEQITLGREALADLDKAVAGGRPADISAESNLPNYGRVSVIGRGIAQDLRNTGAAMLTGRSIMSGNDLAVLAQVYRDPRFETVRYVFTDKYGEIVGESAVSGRLPGASDVAPSKVEDALAWIDERKKEYNAEYFWVMHNHPSGNPSPSRVDIDVTKTIAQRFGDSFAGHIIIDSTQYARIYRDGGAEVAPIRREGGDTLLTPSIQHNVIGAKVANPDDIVAVAKSISEAKNQIVVIGLDSKNKVRTISLLDSGDTEKWFDPKNEARVIATIRRFGRENGIRDNALTLPFALPMSGTERAQIVKAINNGLLVDVVGKNGESARMIYHELNSTASRNIIEEKAVARQLYQGESGSPRGSVEFLDDGRAVIKALNSPDISTLMHEVGHVFRRDLQGEDLGIASEWAGAKKLDNGEWQWNREAEEKFARGFEKYLQDGEAPNVGLRRVFDQFKTWLTTIYSRLRGVLPDTMSDQMRGVYDRLLAEKIDALKPPASVEALADLRAVSDLNPDNMRALLSEAQRQQERVRGEAMFGRMDQLKEAATQGPDRATIHQWLQPNGEPRKVITLGGKRYEFKNGWVDAQGGGLDKTIDEFNQRYKADENRTGGAAQAWFDTLTKARSTYSEMKAMADGDKRTMKRVAKSAENAMGGWQKIIDDLQTRIGEGAKSESDQAARQAMTEAGGDVDKAIESLTARYADQPEQFTAALDALQKRQSEPVATAAPEAQQPKQPIDQLVDAVKSLVDTLQPKPEPTPQQPTAPPEPSPRDKIRQIITAAAQGKLTTEQARTEINKLEPLLRDMTRTEEMAARSLGNNLADGQPRYIQPTARIGGEQINTSDVLPRLGATQDAPGVWRISKDQAADLSRRYDRMMARENGQQPAAEPTTQPAPKAGPSVRDSILRQYRKEFSQMSDTEYGAVARMLDARAGAWAVINESTPDAWYESKFVNPNDRTDPRAKQVITPKPSDTVGGPGAFLKEFHDGKAIIHAVTNKNFLALTHEVGHLFRRDLTKPELDTVSEWAGARRKENGDWEWDVRSEEKFAESFADYAMGKVSNESLPAKIYRKFATWVGHFLSYMTVGITPSKDVQKVFDRLMGEYPELQQVAKQAKESPRVLYQDQSATGKRPEDEEMAGTNFAKKNGLFSRVGDTDPETLARYQDKAVEAGSQEQAVHMLDVNDAVQAAGKKAIDAIEKGFADHVANWQPGEKVYSGQERGLMQKELLRLSQEHSAIFSKAREYGKQLQNSALLDYSDKRGIDTWIQAVAPFAYWGTRQGRNYALRMMANPNLLATYWRYQQAVDKENKKKNVRGRFGASIQVPGTNLYIDPTPWLFPFSDFIGRDSMADAGEAKSTAQQIYDMAGAMGFRPGPALDIPLRYSNLLVDKKPGEQGYGAQEAEYGRGSIGEISPLNGVVQAMTAAVGIGGPTGFDAEGRVRKMLGMHEAETWEPYVISRSISDAAAQANRNGGPMDTRPYLIAQRFVDDNQSNVPTALRETTAQQLSEKYKIDPQMAQQALDIARKAAVTATVQKGMQQMSSFFTGLRAKVLPPGEQARWQMKAYERGAGYNPYTDTGSRKQMQQVQDFFPALQVQRAQYGAVPGDEKSYNYLYVIEEKKRLNAQFDNDLANIIRERPWDRDASKEIDGMRFNVLRQLDEMQGTTPPDETKPSSIYGANKAEALQIRQNDILKLVGKKAPKVENFESYDQFKMEREAYRQNVAGIAAGDPQTAAILQLADREGNGDPLRNFIGGLTYTQVQNYKGRYDLPLEAAQNAYFDLVYEPAILDYNRQLVRGDPKAAWENTIGRVSATDANALANLIKQEYGGRWTDEELAQGLQGMNMPILAEMIKRKYEVAADGGFKYRQDYLYGANNIDPQTEFWRWYRNEIPPGRAANGLRDIPQISSALDPAAAAKMTPGQWESALNLGRAWMASEYGDVPPDARVEWAQAKDESKQLNTLLLKEFGPEGQKLLDMYFNAPDAKTKAAMRKQIPMLDAILDMRQTYAEKKGIYDAYYGPGSYGNKKNAQGKYSSGGGSKSSGSRYSRGSSRRRSSSRSSSRRSSGYTRFNNSFARGYTGYIVKKRAPSSGLGPIQAPQITPRKVKMNPLKG